MCLFGKIEKVTKKDVLKQKALTFNRIEISTVFLLNQYFLLQGHQIVNSMFWAVTFLVTKMNVR